MPEKLNWNEEKHRYEWSGSARELVDLVGNSDARLGPVFDLKSGAKISMNLNGGDGLTEEDEPFYVESPSGENMWDPANRKEATRLIEAARKGHGDNSEEYMYGSGPIPNKNKPKAKHAKKASRSAPRTSLRGVRR